MSDAGSLLGMATNPAPGLPISRRALLTGLLGTGFIVATGASILQASPAFANFAPTSAVDMASLALSCVGKTLAQLQSAPMTDSPYSTYQGDWCAVFATWLARGAGIPYKTYAVDAYNSATHVTSPLVGDFIYYQATGLQHVGVVVAVNAGIPETVEGNTHTSPWPVAIVSHYTSPWSTPAASKSYSRPNWPNTQSQLTGDNEMWYIRNLDTGVISILGVGGKGYHSFASIQEYTDWGTIVSYANTTNGAGLPAPPPAPSVFGCSTALYNTALAIASGA